MSFRCLNGLCIPDSWRCDRDMDCEDGQNGTLSSDELDCGGWLTSVSLGRSLSYARPI